MDDSQILSVFTSRLEQSQDSSIPESEAQRALDYYYGRPRGDELPGRSRVMSTDVADMIHSVQASLMPAFAGDSVCEFEPLGPGDEEASSLEGKLVNRAIMESNRGYIAIQQALHNALLFGWGILKTWTEGDPRKVMVEAVDPLNFRVDSYATSPLLTDAQAIFERHVYERGQLLEMGIDRAKVEQIQLLQPGALAERRLPTGYRQDANTDAGWAAEMVEVWEGYLRLAVDDDEVATWRILASTEVLLEKEKVDSHPYAVGVPIVLPGQARGMSLYERLKQVQDTKTTYLRQLSDSFSASNLSRLLVNSQTVDPESLSNGRINGYVLNNGPVSDAAKPLPNQDISAQVLQALAYQDQVRSDRAGASLAMQGAESQLLKSQIGAAGAIEVMQSSELVAGWYARNLAETLLRSVFGQVHRLMRSEMAETEFRVATRNGLVVTTPSQWPERTTVNISAGLTPAERSRKAAQLSSLLAYQAQFLTAGLDGILVGPSELYRTCLAWGRAVGIDGIERMVIDPESAQARQAAQGKAQMQQQMVQLQMQQEQQKLELDKYKHDSELKWRYFDTQLDNQTKRETTEAEIVGGAATTFAASALGAAAGTGDSKGSDRQN